MKKKILFHDFNLTVRGTSVALYNYADYNERILGNESIIMAVPDDDTNKAKEKFTRRFKCNFSWFHGFDTQNYCNKENIDFFYVTKQGTNDGVLLLETPTLVHSVFCNNEPHGDKYAYISDWLAKNQGYNPETHSVPYIAEKLPPPSYNLREKLGIPKEKLVFGCYGGPYEFNIHWVHHAISQIVKQRNDIVFIFMNIVPFCEEHENIIHLPGTWVLEEKSAFVNACDAMLHARSGGETFGLACAEFALENKPVITYGLSGERNHLEVMGERAIIYNDYNQIYDILTNFKNYVRYDDYFLPYTIFSPEIIMEKFNKVFLS